MAARRPCLLVTLVATTLCFSTVANAAWHRQYVDPAKAVSERDLTLIDKGFFSSGKAPFEYQTRGTLTVGYSMVPDSTAGKALRLTLVFRNAGSTTESITPSVQVTDGDGFMLAQETQANFRARAEALAHTQIPDLPPQPAAYGSSATSETRGTITDEHGHTSDFNARSKTTDDSNDYKAAIDAQNNYIRALSAHTDAVKAQNSGALLIQWSNANYLKDNYEVPSGLAVFGAIMLPSKEDEKMPLTVKVTIGDKEFVFKSQY